MEAAAAWIPVRVTDLRGVDLDTFRFDFDLTFAVLLMHPDGTVYHRFGGRDATSAEVALSRAALVRLLREGLATHVAHRERGRPPAPGSPRTLDDIPAWRQRLDARARRGERPLDCYHCHFVADAERAQGLADGTWRPEMIWRWPPPSQVGLALDPDRQDLVRAVTPGSPAALAGVEAGDRVLELDGQRVLSWSDLSFALERARGGARTLPLRLERAGAAVEARLELAAGWERGDALTLAWRPSKWQLTPNPGFGGQPLAPEEKRALGLAPDAFALRVTYLITWNQEARFGKAAIAAGIAKGDVVLGVNGERGFSSHDHFQAWWRLSLRPGDTARVELLRGGERREAVLSVIE